jgi:two-component system, chemotaxis family, CheB/CheR fusion protein
LLYTICSKIRRFQNLDLISCRNLLIYLDRDAQRRAFDIFHFALREGGILFLGSSESVEEASADFTALDKKYRLYARGIGNRHSVLGGPTSLASALNTHHRIPSVDIVNTTALPPTSLSPVSSGTTPARSRSWAELHFKFLERLAPPSVIVDGNYDIIHLSEHAGQYLQLGGGTSTLNLLRIVHPMLRTELRAALFRARQIGAEVIVSGIPMEIEGVRHTIDLRVSPAPEVASDFLLVVFDAKEKVVQSETIPLALSRR